MKRPSMYFAIAIALTLVLPLALSAQLDESARDVYTIDHEYLDIAKSFPGFGGLFHDEEGVANIYVTDTANRSQITTLADGEVNFLPADYAWDELFEVRESLTDVMNEPGVVFLDIDERTNRVTVGITGVKEEASRFDRKRAIASRYGVPEGALAIVETAPVERVVTLRQSRRPIPAGMEIRWPGPGGTFLCTVGFIIRQGGTRGFITNSHCSGTQGGNQNTPYRQPTGSIIAREIKDPGYRFGISGCPSGRRCRRSDSAMARFSGNNGSLGQFARIARTTCRNCGGLTIAGGGSSRFRITQRGNVGSGTLHKVGRTTGWTSGPKVGSCQTTNVAGTNITLICQDRVRAGVAGGDSGSPVFRRLSGNQVRLVGILWGGGGGDFVYSPLNQVVGELGSFAVN